MLTKSFVAIPFAVLLYFVFTQAAEIQTKESVLKKHQILLNQVNETRMSICIEDILNSDDFQRASKYLIRVIANHLLAPTDENLPKTMQTSIPSLADSKVARSEPAAQPATHEQDNIQKGLSREVIESLVPETKPKKPSKKPKLVDMMQQTGNDFVESYIKHPDSIGSLLAAKPTEKHAQPASSEKKAASKDSLSKLLSILTKIPKAESSQSQKGSHLIPLSNDNAPTKKASADMRQALVKLTQMLNAIAEPSDDSKTELVENDEQ